MKRALTMTFALMLILFGVQNLKAYDFTVSGVVLQTSAQVPAPDVMVKLHIESTPIFENTFTGEDGTYSVTVVINEDNPLTYKVIVFDACTGQHIIKTGDVTPDGAIEDFLICESGNQNCHADFMFHHNHQNPNPLEIDFHSTSHGYGPIVTFAWDFGDGNTSNEQNPTHVFADFGNYEVTLTITTESGCTDSETKTVVIEQIQWGCEAEFEYHQSHHTPLLVHFIDKSQFLPGTWAWDFGDGETSGDKNPDHTYAAAGEYTVTLTINGADTTCVDTYTKIVEVEENGGGGQQGCEADFIYHHSWNQPMEIHFIDKSQFLPGTWAWDFGDGETSGEKNPHHQYNAAGEYIVTLTINGADTTCVDTQIKNIVVEDNTMNCQANFWWHHNHQSGNPLEIKFLNNSYAYGTITSFAWDFGDGTTSDEENPVHAYAETGLYNVTLAIVTENGCASDRTLQVWVHDWTSNCLALFVPVIDSINPLQVYFEDYSLGRRINSWYWEFGDGTSSNEQNPTHIYPEATVYTASLTIETNNCTSSFYYEINLVNGQVMVSPGPTTGISNKILTEITLYPNPVQDILGIRMTSNVSIEVQIMNLTGQTLISSASTVVDVSSLPKGIYFAIIKANGQSTSMKFIK